MKTSNIILGAIALELGIIVAGKTLKHVKRHADKKEKDNEAKIFNYSDILINDLRSYVDEEVNTLREEEEHNREELFNEIDNNKENKKDTVNVKTVYHYNDFSDMLDDLVDYINKEYDKKEANKAKEEPKECNNCECKKEEPKECNNCECKKEEAKEKLHFDDLIGVVNYLMDDLNKIVDNKKDTDTKAE